MSLDVEGELRLRSNLAVSSSMVRGGRLALSAHSRLEVGGAFSQAGLFSIRVDVSGSATPGRVVIAGSASIAGALQFVGVDGYQPVRGDNPPILSAAAVVGRFSTPLIPGISSGLKAVLISDPTGVRLLITSRADTQESGAVDFADTVWFLNTWFSGNVAADFNQSGDLHIKDIFTFLNAWFSATP